MQAGFECSTHKLRSGKRLDLLRSTEHDRYASKDYTRLHDFGIRTVRLGARWHLIEAAPREYSFDSLDVFIDAAAETGTEFLLDLLHFGWPDHLDVFAPSFPRQFGRYVHALARHVRRRANCCTMFAPVNEISFLSWGGGDVACVNPHARRRGAELKRNLVRCAVVASEILLNELDGVRLISPEPVIHIVGNPSISGDELEAENYRTAQFQAWDMLSGRLAPELGGRPEYLDIIGVNFYDRNQWIHNSTVLSRTDPRYRPFHQILEEVRNRYHRPIFVSETGTEGAGRAEWFNYICDQVIQAHICGTPVHGICLYPIINHPGWEDDRYCCNGLFDYADNAGERDVHWPLAHALINQQQKLQGSYQSVYDPEQHRPHLPLASSLGFRIPAAAAPNEPIRA
ncbi:MAG: hypothetical protein WB992_12025 [Bryobacteraceae bacterium]